MFDFDVADLFSSFVGYDNEALRFHQMAKARKEYEEGRLTARECLDKMRRTLHAPTNQYTDAPTPGP